MQPTDINYWAEHIQIHMKVLIVTDKSFDLSHKYQSLSSFLFLFHLSSFFYLSPTLSHLNCLHSFSAVGSIGLRAFWPVEQVTALTGPPISLCASSHLSACLSHFNIVNMGLPQATENILCSGAHSLETRLTPDVHLLCILQPVSPLNWILK